MESVTTAEVTAANLEFNEADHPRGTGDKGGQFVPKSQGGTGASQPGWRLPAPRSRRKKGSGGGTKYAGPPPTADVKATKTLTLKGPNDPAAVAQLQAFIRELKLVDVASDGQFGPATQEAVKAVQARLGLKTTGSASPALIRRLREAHMLSPCIDRTNSQVTAAYDPGEAEHTGAMVALVPTDDDAELLAVDGGEPADELHCTLLYLGEADDYDDDQRDAITAAVGEIAAGYDPVEADGFAISLFNPDSDERDPCIVLGLSGAELAEIHADVADQVEASPDQHQPWVPHITLVYDPDNPAAMVADLADLTGPVVFDRLRVAFGDDVYDYPLGG